MTRGQRMFSQPLLALGIMNISTLKSNYVSIYLESGLIVIKQIKASSFEQATIWPSLVKLSLPTKSALCQRSQCLNLIDGGISVEISPGLDAETIRHEFRPDLASNCMILSYVGCTPVVTFDNAYNRLVSALKLVTVIGRTDRSRQVPDLGHGSIKILKYIKNELGI
jgi:hypothetical protein